MAANRPPRCGECDIRLHPLSVSDAIEPFHHRPWRFLAYPLNLGPAMHVLILSALSLLGILPLLGWLFFALVWFLLLHQALMAFKDTALGYLRPPEVALQTVSRPLVIKAALLLTALPLTIFVFDGRIGAWTDIPIIAGIALFVLPLMLMRLGIEESLLAAINPLGWPIPIQRLGLDYWRLLAMLAALIGGATFLSQVIADAVPSQWLLPLVSPVQMGATLIGFHLIGYAVFQHHERLGTPVAQTRLDELESQP